jgi:hypothetical protein
MFATLAPSLAHGPANEIGVVGVTFREIRSKRTLACRGVQCED